VSSGPANQFRWISALVVVAGTAGCASPGPPKPPSLNLPALATDIRAQRLGNQVVVTWTTPSSTSDSLPFTGPITAELCREVGPRPLTPAARLTACAPVRRLTVTPGRSQTTDSLPPELTADPVQLLTYRVQLFNSADRSAGESQLAGFAAAGAAPPTVEDLRASNLEAGTVLEWQPSSAPGIVDLERIDLTPPAAHRQTSEAVPAPPSPANAKAAAGKTTDSKTARKNKKAKGKSKAASHPAKTTPQQGAQESQTAEVHLRITEPTVATTPARDSTHSNPASANAPSREGTVDQTAQMGSTYRYAAGRVRIVTLGVHKLEIESALSPAVSFAHLDVFPPHQPTGLEAIPGSDSQNPDAIDLSWEPNPETDLAGYLVFRQPLDGHGAPTGPAIQLTPAPITPPAFRDLTALAGRGYAYQVAAVDQSGNRSTLSDPVQQTAAH
jgi:hypothetical protein